MKLRPKNNRRKNATDTKVSQQQSNDADYFKWFNEQEKETVSKTPLIKGSKDKELFPHLNRFPYAFFPGKKHEDHLNKAWFDDLDRIQAWIRKHKLKQNEYTAYHYTGKK